MRTITWDYDTNTVTEWYRMGGCNHCGLCCEVIINIKTCGTYDEDVKNGGSGVDGKGQWHQWDNGKPHYWKVEQIDYDTSEDCFERCEGQCVDGWENKKLICQVWPLHPDHVNEFDDCSYRFVKLNEWEIEAHEPEEEKQEIIE